LKLKAPKETVIQRDILNALKSLGIPAWRNKNIPTPGRRAPKDTIGIPDILGVIPHGPRRGCLLAIEVKRPGHEPEPAQAAYLKLFADAGAVSFYATSVEQVLDWLPSPYGLDEEPPYAS